EKETKKEAFRNYLEFGGNDKSSFLFIQQNLGGLSVSDYEKLQAEKSNLQIKYMSYLLNIKKR
ncbi:hypothetical protein HID58_084895, partial [Brassica napus]